MQAGYRRQGRASGKKKPFLVGGEDKGGSLGKNLGEWFEKPAANWPDEGVGKAKAGKHGYKGSDQAGA